MVLPPSRLLHAVYLFLICTPLSVNAQDCPDNISAPTQEALVALMEVYPDCEFLPGTLNLSGTVADLSPLQNLKTVGGLSIRDNDVLNNLQGLNSLVSVGANLDINRCHGLSSLNGLNSLSSTGGSVSISFCDALQSLQGLESLENIGNSLLLSTNPELPAIGEFHALMNVGGDLTITNMEKLQSISAFELLEIVGGQITLRNCDNLLSISGFESVSTVNGGIEILFNKSLLTVAAFENLVSVPSFDLFDQEPALLNVSGLDALESVDGLLRIKMNNKVTGAIPEFMELKTVGGRLDMTGAIGVMSFPKLESVGNDLLIGSLFLSELEGLDKLVSVGGNLQLQTSLSNLPDFERLESVGGKLVFDSDETLEVLDGFNALRSIGDDGFDRGLDIFDHDKLKTIEGFNSLEAIEGWFAIEECDKLTKVEGFANLSHVEKDFIVWSNDMLTDCKVFCDFIENGTLGGEYRINWNGPNLESGCRNLDKVNLNCSFTHTFLDANLILDLDDYDSQEPNNIRDLTVEEVMELDDVRLAVSADGVSSVVIKLQFEQSGMVELPVQPDAEEYFEMIWGNETMEIDGENILYVLFTPPEVFDENKDLFRIEGEVAAYDFIQQVDLVTEEIENLKSSSDRLTFSMAIPIARPPVVLVHGTLSSPELAWHTNLEGQMNMFDTMTIAGFKVFTLDYESTNGAYDGSSFEINKMVLWGITPDGPETYATGGIKEALGTFREEFKIAATQVDVVAHDMGGLLARVYASNDEGGYNPNYKRNQNFMEGDINRLVTIATPHFGSEFREFQVFLQERSSLVNLPDFSLMDWLATNALTFFYWYNGLYASDAIVDQTPMPGNPALAKIGATEVPAHAIICNVPFGQGSLKDSEYDPTESFYDLYWYTTLLLYNNIDVRNVYLDQKVEKSGNAEMYAGVTISGRDVSDLVAGYEDAKYFKEMVDDGLWYAGQVMAVLDGTWVLPAGATILKYAFAEVGMSDYTDPLIDIVINDNLAGVAAGSIADYVEFPSAEDVIVSYLSTNDRSMEVVRSLIFDNDYNDGVVRSQSQTGKLDAHCVVCTTTVNDVLHDFATQHPRTRKVVVDVLKNGMNDFYSDGFPAISEPLKLYLPDSLVDIFSVSKTGPPAICQSGMVPGHARAFARIANQEDIVIMVRPVNPDATQLIGCGAATKMMNVKPKSSNWGPQRGYLPTNQRYSKIWEIFDEPERSININKYNEKVQENLDNNITVEKPLQVSICERWYNVFVDLNEYTGMDDKEDAESEIVLVPVNSPEMVCQWDHNSSNLVEGRCRPITPEDDLSPFTVMGTPNDPENQTPSIYLTADYDLLMIGRFAGEDQGPPMPPDNIPFDPETGQITPGQQALLMQLNDEVRQTGYTGGNVTHHGPENQFEHSPYIDYPITVFAPDKVSNGPNKESTGGRIYSIEMGPKGFRDMNLKRLVNELRDQGYNLYDNMLAPGWDWNWNEETGGYDLEDSEHIGNYVQQLPLNYCDKTGTQIRPCDCGMLELPEIEMEPPSSWLGNNFTAENTSGKLMVFPNPIQQDELNIDITISDLDHAEYIVQDALGNVLIKRPAFFFDGKASAQIDVGLLHPGLYTVSVIPGGMSVRFVKL